MQLIPPQPTTTSPEASPLRAGLSIATACLLGGTAMALEATSPYEVDARLLFYTEPDRVSLVETKAQVTWDRGDDRVLSLSLTLDSLTGSSPNGAIPSAQAQTFTSPSGNASYVIPAGEPVLDPSFKDTRVGIDLAGTHPWDEVTRLSWGAHGSSEYDYKSFGGDVGVQRDFFQRTTTLALGLSLNHDISRPVGGVPVAGAWIPAFPAVKEVSGATESKNVLDVQVGMTQILTPRSLIRTNLVLGLEDGYLNDPYKLVSVVDPVTGDIGADPDRRYRTESRPDSKMRWAWYTAWQQGVSDRDVLRLSYRLYNDDWGMLSHTVDSFYRWQFSDRMFLEPHLRGYLQSAADFYRTSIASNETVSEVSADYRLAEMWTSTVGLTWGTEVTAQGEVRLGAEWYHQEPTPSSVIGAQSRANLVEPVDAYMARAGITWQW